MASAEEKPGNAVPVENLKVGGEKAGFCISSDFKPEKPEEKKKKLIFSVCTENSITHRRGKTEHMISG